MTSKLAASGNAIVLPLSSYRDPDNRTIVLKFEAPLALPSGDDIKDAVTVNQWLETCIRRHPDQYLWLHKRFKTRPEGQPSVYK
jgi:KDO2-lipid IV(A) lauroyltransferase